MKHSIFVKFIAFALCAAALLAAVGGGLGILLMVDNGLYDREPEEIYADSLEDQAFWKAQQIAQNYASTQLGGCPEEMLGNYQYFETGYYGYTLRDTSGAVLEQVKVDGEENAFTYTFTVTGSYMKVQAHYPEEEAVLGRVEDNISDSNSLVYGISYNDRFGEGDGLTLEEPLGVIGHTQEGCATFTAVRPQLFSLTEEPLEVTSVVFYDERGEVIYEAARQETVGLMEMNEDGLLVFTALYPADQSDQEYAPTEAVRDVDHFGYYDSEQGKSMVVEYTWEVMPEYLVTMTVLPDVIYNDYYYTMAELLTAYREWYPWALVLGLLLFAITAVYLCCAAGRRPGTEEVRPAGPNRVPLDLYFCITGGTVCLLFAVLMLIAEELFYDSTVMVALGLMALTGYAMALVLVAFCYAFAAQVKSRDGYWWRHMVIGWAFRQVLRFFRWLGRGMKWLRNGIRGVFNLLPVIWQWLVTAALMVVCPLFFLVCVSSCWHDFWTFLWGCLFIGSVVVDIALVVYGGWCFGTLLKGAKTMSQGNLNHQVDTRYHYGIFRDFGNRLNNLAEGAKIAAQRQLKSERMKTELITNVSHDIKTPLTSIINYVDLLKKPHSPQEDGQYLEVLDRQSQRLKKLVDDLMEMSKASTGNLSVELGPVDAVEAVNQALGEFADKLAAVNLTPVFRHPEEPVTMLADGRLVWRVLSNLLSNACKYALPDTRLYLDLMVLQGNAVIAIKNISREQLNVGADELMERFVRGDTSRNTEGSGLGLNIAKSLVELQHGQMHLMVDGDLFKVTLIFPLE